MSHAFNYKIAPFVTLSTIDIHCTTRANATHTGGPQKLTVRISLPKLA